MSQPPAEPEGPKEEIASDAPAEVTNAPARDGDGAPAGEGDDAAAEGDSPIDDNGARRRRWPAPRVLVPLLTVVVAVGAGGLVLAARDRCPSSGAALEVKGRAVKIDELEGRVDVLRALYGVKPPPESDTQGNDAFRRDTAKAVAVSLIIEREVKSRNLLVAGKAVQDALDRYIAQTFPQDGRDGFIKSLSGQGISEAVVLGEFRRLLETQRLFVSVTDKTNVTDEEVAQAFQQRQAELAVPERRHLRHLVVARETDANAALARIQKGEPFPAVAKTVSLDASTKDSGGDLKEVSAAELDPAFGKAAFAAPVHQPFGPVKTNLGWHVGYVEGSTPGRPVTLDEVRQQLHDRLVAEKRLAEWRGFVGERVKSADACYASRFRPADPDAPPPDLPGPTPTASR